MPVSQITVFGGSGFLGRHTVRALARAGYRLRVAVRDPHTANFLRPMGRVGQIDIVHADVTQDEAVRKALEGSDAAVNLVGILYERGRQKFDPIHVEAAERIAQVATAEGLTSLIHISAIGAAPSSQSRYARSKALGETAVRKAFPRAVILRPSIIFGPEDEFFNRFAALARISLALPLIGGGKTRFQPVFVGDVARAIEKTIVDPSIEPRLFELGGPSVYTFRALMEYILEVVDRRRALIPIPFALARLIALAAGLAPKPLLTVDQVRLLRSDNVVGSLDAETGDFSTLGMDPNALETIVPSYLQRYRRRGQFQEGIAASTNGGR